jgi:hypothetical protein
MFGNIPPPLGQKFRSIYAEKITQSGRGRMIGITPGGLATIWGDRGGTLMSPPKNFPGD